MTTVVRWSGVEARALREARRMSVRAFAAHLGVAVASVTNWERRGEQIRLRDETQQILDRDLSCASDDVRSRFEAHVGGGSASFGQRLAGDEGRLAYVLANPSRTDATAVAHLREQIARLDADYDHEPSAALLGSAGQRHGQVAFLCAHASSARIRRELLPPLAESAVLMGQLVWDASLRRDHAAALSYFDTAIRAADACGDRVAACRAQLRRSYVALYGEKSPGKGLEMAAQAAATGRTASNVLTGLALLHVAEAHAMRRHLRPCEEALNKADTYLGKVNESDEASPLFTPSDRTRLAGSCYLHLDDAPKAVLLLADTLRSAGQTKAAAIAAANLCLAYTGQRKIDEAVGSLHQAIDIASATRGGGGLTLAFAAGRALRPWRDVSAVQHVHDRLLSLMSA